MFHTEVQRVFKEMERNIMYILQIIYCCFPWWKNFENWLTIDEVIANSSTPRFYTQGTSIGRVRI